MLGTSTTTMPLPTQRKATAHGKELVLPLYAQQAPACQYRYDMGHSVKLVMPRILLD